MSLEFINSEPQTLVIIQRRLMWSL
jgi:hypothetical protein